MTEKLCFVKALLKLFLESETPLKCKFYITQNKNQRIESSRQ
jgi:hypothetical protein